MCNRYVSREEAEIECFWHIGRDNQPRWWAKERLEHVWSAMIETNRKPHERVLVMVRGNVTRDYEDHVLLIRIDPLADIRTEVKRYCSEFARDQLSERLKQNILLTHTR